MVRGNPLGSSRSGSFEVTVVGAEGSQSESAVVFSKYGTRRFPQRKEVSNNAASVISDKGILAFSAPAEKSSASK